MDKSILVFVVGLWGVFIGMAILYTTIKITAFITGKIKKGEDNK